MACVDITPANADSEMEEGEIVDELDDLSDISSEEEFLLRERLQVLENYNNVLERTKAKQISLGSNGVLRVECKVIKESKHIKPHHKHKKSEHKKYIDKENGKSKRKKNIVRRKKSVTSEDSEDDYRNKRQKLADAVSLNKPKNDTTSLKDRITKMLSGNKVDDEIPSENEKFERRRSENDTSVCIDIAENETATVVTLATSKSSECIVSAMTNEDKKVACEEVSCDVVDSGKGTVNSEGSSDEDIELLRQHALQTKSSKIKVKEQSNDLKNVPSSDDEDSDTTELRLICLKSALLKKAIEMKRKQKLQKKLSQSQSEFEFDVDLNGCENQTDVESVDMDIGSDGDDKNRGNINDNNCNRETNSNNIETKSKDDDIEEDEDLLRAKLLTSLTKNLPNLVDPQVLNSIVDVPSHVKSIEETKPPDTKEEKKFIIQLGESDSDGEHEATKNLTKMHKKLSDQEEFQRQLDMFLKSSRMEVEKNILPDVVQPPLEKPAQKFVAKAMNSLPKSEQIEYKNLVKRMQELEKIKNARQTLLNMNKIPPVKDTLKPSNTVKVTNINSIELDERIAASRRKIADESAKMLKLKEEATKLSQKYQLLQVELRNVRNAIRINKKFQRTVQNGLYISRLQHQSLLKSLTNAKHSTQIPVPTSLNRPVKLPTNKLQKENNPALKDINNPQVMKAVKVSVVNDLNSETPHPRLSVQVDITNNKKVVKSSAVQDRMVKFTNSKEEENRNTSDTNTTYDNYCISQNQNNLRDTKEIVNDYKSPLDALRNKSWVEDPNAFLCPFEVGGSCRDPDCKHIHPKTQ